MDPIRPGNERRDVVPMLSRDKANLGPCARIPRDNPNEPVDMEARPYRLTTRDIIREAVEAQKEGREPGGKWDRVNPVKEEGERMRGPDGKFVPGVDKPAPDRTGTPGRPGVAAPAAQTLAPGAAAPAVAAVDPNAPVVDRPPPGWSPQSKVDFDKLPAHIKADIVKREAEVNRGFEKLASYKPVEKYFDMALKGGTTLDKALEQYVGIEQLLRKDVFAGIERVLQNVGIKDPRQFVTAYQQRLAGGHQPAPQTQQQAPTPQSVDPQKIAAQVRAELQHEQAMTAANREVQAFAADPKNRFYENVKVTMGWLAQQGRVHTVQEAYDMACRMDPEISKLLNQPAPVDPRAVRAAAAANSARAAAKAVIGAPRSGQPSAAAPSKGQSTRAIMEAAVAAQKGARV